MTRVTALTSLICASLTEDDYGVVQKNVAAVLDAFYSTLSALQRFVTEPPLHWTDVDAKTADGELKLKEPEMLMEELRSGIHQIMEAFEPYRDSVLTPELLKKLQNVEY